MRKSVFQNKLTLFLLFAFASFALYQCKEQEKEIVKDNTPKIIVSTIDGGDWNEAKTWIQGVVPTKDSDVNITGRVSVTGNAECLNLMIDAGSLLEVQKGAVLKIYHHVIQEGTVINNGNITLKEQKK